MPDDVEPLRATKLRVARCAHGTVFVELLDDAGEVFAYGAVDADTADRASFALAEAAADARAGAPIPPRPDGKTPKWMN
jgi:hypothetical protein